MPVNFHLICVHPFGNYTKGQLITDADEVAKLSDDREHHFVRIAAPATPAAPDAPAAPDWSIPVSKPML
jgi:hypothetical protein